MSRRRTYRRPRPTHTCAARHCQAQTHLDFCPKHWKMVPVHFRASLRSAGYAHAAAVKLAADQIAIQEGYCGDD